MNACTFTISGLTFDAANVTAFPPIGETGKIYLALDTGLLYRWASTSYVGIASPLKIVARDEGTLLTSSVSAFNFTGSGVTATNVGSLVTINVPSSAIAVADEGTALGNFNVLNVVGSGVGVALAGTTATITVAATAATTNTLTSAVNTLTSTVDGVVATAPAVNTNTLVLTGSNLVSTVNGVASAAAVLPTLTVSDEGVSLTTAMTSLNAVGTGITATNVLGAVTLTVPKITSFVYNAIGDGSAVITYSDGSTIAVAAIPAPAVC